MRLLSVIHFLASVKLGFGASFCGGRWFPGILYSKEVCLSSARQNKPWKERMLVSAVDRREDSSRGE
uniref:Secreted protein n=1 Tax=Setaria digitata TaxID=48799 RepID=A0A915PSJ9_9BILA